MTIRRLFLSAWLVWCAPAFSVAQPPHQGSAILTDLLVFHGPDITGKEYVDVYVSVPYRTLQFQQYDGRYAASFTATIALRDKVGRKIADTTIERSRVEESYAVTQGSTGQSENCVARFLVNPGSYRYEVVVRDMFARRDYTVTDTATVPDLSNTPSMSSVMYVSQVEERNGRYAITPYIGSTVWSAEVHLFAFFEVYTVEIPQSIACSWSIRTSDGRTLGQGLGDVLSLSKRVTQHFLPLRLRERAAPGRYQLTVAVHPVINGLPDTTVQLTQSSRPYIVPRTLAGSVMSDIALAIKQLAYIASQAEIDEILAAQNDADRTYRFEMFWKKHDPTPNTVVNEAFVEYYNRIATANRLFKSYADGWLTDMGRVFIIYGEPPRKEKSTSTTNTVLLERWFYADNRVFVFEDNTGFGDFRLRTPLPADAKYRYR